MGARLGGLSFGVAAPAALCQRQHGVASYGFTLSHALYLCERAVEPALHFTNYARRSPGPIHHNAAHKVQSKQHHMAIQQHHRQQPPQWNSRSQNTPSSNLPSQRQNTTVPHRPPTRPRPPILRALLPTRIASSLSASRPPVCHQSRKRRVSPTAPQASPARSPPPSSAPLGRLFPKMSCVYLEIAGARVLVRLTRPISPGGGYWGPDCAYGRFAALFRRGLSVSSEMSEMSVRWCNPPRSLCRARFGTRSAGSRRRPETRPGRLCCCLGTSRRPRAHMLSAAAAAPDPLAPVPAHARVGEKPRSRNRGHSSRTAPNVHILLRRPGVQRSGDQRAQGSHQRRE